MAALMPLGKQQYFAASGAPLVGGKVYTYAAGTTSPLATYSDKAGVTPNTNPVILDSRGEATIFWGQAGYKVVLKDSTDATIWTQDNLYAVQDSSSMTFAQELITATAGQTVFNLSISYTNGTNSLAVYCNGLRLPSTDYTETSTTSVTMNTGATVGDEFLFVAGDFAASTTGADLVTYTPSGTGAVATTVQTKLRSISLSATDFGVVGDGSTDDYAAFVKACAAAVTAKRPLDISNLKIYLASQAASISSDGLYLIGSGYLKGQVAAGDIDCIPVDWTYEVGTVGSFATNKAVMVGYRGSVIFSQYNGPIFTGKAFSGENFTVIGDPLYASNQCFKQSTATSYPGWSQPFKRLKDFSCAYFGSHGLQAMGGSELTTMRNVSSSFCKGYCLYIGQTNGINSPIEYLDIDGGWYADGLLGNIYLEGVSKSVQIHNNTLISPGQLGRINTNPGSLGATIFPIWLKLAPGSLITAGVNIDIHDNVAESAQGMVFLDAALSGSPYWYGVQIHNNYLLPQNNAWGYYNVVVNNTFAVNLTTWDNFSPSGVNMYFAPSANHNGFDIQERFNASGVVLTLFGNSFTDNQWLRPRIYPGDSGSLGDGTANYFQTTIFADSITTPANKAGVPTLYLISADNQITGVGAYLLSAVRTNSGQWYGTVAPFGSTSGFSGAPGILTNGAIYANTTLGYRVRVKRIDMGIVNPATY